MSCTGSQCDKLLDDVYQDIKDINLYDILWTCYHGGRPRQEALLQVSLASLLLLPSLCHVCGKGLVGQHCVQLTHDL